MDLDEKARARMYHLACHLEDGLRLQSGPLIVRSECSSTPAFSGNRRDSMLMFARQGAEARGQFMRPAELKQVMPDGESRASLSKNTSKISGDCAKKEDEEFSSSKVVKSREDETPLFARPASKHAAQIKSSRPVTEASEEKRETSIRGFEWSPRMDVTESDSEHIVTVELPGVNAEGIRVEIDRGRLVVTGFRSREWWSSSQSFTQSSESDCRVYHRRDISYGPYRSVWSVPKNANLNGATAEFIDGFLRVIIPKS
ncbi:hypothetical protein SELMODRAFT_441564 [Selaginella moellendorffii]|uniref:SHSP domain-containing protein n=1 Tax=Selaginella moellendorffii TaxID=88036 RepID=D8RKP3_SELML|nr:uncharacterized protein LOC9639983 isoform X1 [Selaginella moellendorffii]EFJ27477.1 hypothetical protein SELMODRAFT_441564 [Selaginella moellendorffii]|eukprot:XP_002971728.1 uncharacterized protein LOC9639983 isoform X1 [Selaginella moellendorffii]